MSDYKDMCDVDRMLPIHQLNKINEKGTKRDDFFPLSVIQAIFDKTGIRLDTIISSFNYIFLPYKGTKEDTRLQVVGLMRRKSLVICYRDLDDNIIIEMYNGTDRNDNVWKDDDNWIDFSNYIKKAVEEILTNLNDYPDIVTAIQQACVELINNYLNEHFEDTANKYFAENINKVFEDWAVDNISQYINDYLSQHLKDIANEYFDSHIEELTNNYLDLHFQDEFNKWIQDNAQSYFDKYLTDNSQTIINNWLEDNSTDTINNWMAENAEKAIQTAVNNYFNNEEFNSKLVNVTTPIVNDYLADNLEPIVGEFFNKVVTYIQQNERVIANALARHEQSITDLQNTDTQIV